MADVMRVRSTFEARRREVEMKLIQVLGIAAASLFLASHSLPAANSSSNPGNCKVVEQESSGANTGSTMSSSVTAGGGQVSGSTTGAGNSVTVRSGDGAASSSIATAGGSAGSTVVTGSGGDCTIYVNPGKKDQTK